MCMYTGTASNEIFCALTPGWTMIVLMRVQARGVVTVPQETVPALSPGQGVPVTSLCVPITAQAMGNVSSPLAAANVWTDMKVCIC